MHYKDSEHCGVHEGQPTETNLSFIVCRSKYKTDVNNTKFLTPRQRPKQQDQDRCLQDQDQNNKTKTTGSKQGHLADLTFKWTPLLISTVVMFQAQNRETTNSTWKVAVSFKIIVTMSVTRPCFTTQNQTCKTKSARPSPQHARQRPFFGLRPVLS